MAFEADLELGRLCAIRKIVDKAGLGITTVHPTPQGRVLQAGQLAPITLRQLDEEKIARAIPAKV